MRPVPETPIRLPPFHDTIHVFPSNTETNTSICDKHDCRWWPYANSTDFGSNVALLLILLLCAIICVFAINTAIRCFMRSSTASGNDNRRRSSEMKARTGSPPTVVSTVVVYSTGMKFGECTDCVICLSEFDEGEGVRVLGRCKHAFHVQCIEQWLARNFSCPTCRGNCLASPSPETGSVSRESQEGDQSIPM